MALDHALAEAVIPGAAFLRFYTWERATVSFGRNEPARDLYDRGEAGRSGLAFVRRPTGGRAVLHDDEVTYAVVAPIRAMGGLRAAYRRINEGLVAGLSGLGAPVALAGGAPALPPDAGPCFQAPAEGEVVAGGRKLVGSAQVRVGSALLQHGSIILGGDQRRLEALEPRREAAEPPARLSDLVESVDRGTVVGAMRAGLESVFGGRWEDRAVTADEEAEAARWEAERYALEEWTWRR
jgi:lipoyl(octanoyl) transferase